jgi:hypothetical protein
MGLPTQISQPIELDQNVKATEMNSVTSKALRLLIPTFLFLAMFLNDARSQLVFFNQSGVETDMKTRITELAQPKSNIPDNPTLLGQEYNRIDQEISRYSIYATPSDNDISNIIPGFDKVRDDLAKFGQGMSSVDCSDTEKYKSVYDALSSAGYRLSAVMAAMPQINNLNIDLHAVWALPGIRGAPANEGDLGRLGPIRTRPKGIVNHALIRALKAIHGQRPVSAGWY